MWVRNTKNLKNYFYYPMQAEKQIKKIAQSNLFVILFLSFLTTDIWFYVFRSTTSFLDTAFRRPISKDFIVHWVYQKPYDIPIFLLLTIGTVLLILFSYKPYNINKYKSLISKNSIITLIIFYIFFDLLFSFWSNLGVYPYSHDLPSHSLFTTESRIITFFVYSALVIGFIIGIYKLRLLNLFRKNTFAKISLVVIGIIAYITFEPSFPIEWHDYSYFIGPILEIAHGKTIIAQTPSQYGFLWVIILGVLTHFGLFNVAFLPVLIWILYIVEYYLCFYLIYQLSECLLYSLIGLFSIITINYFSLCHLPATFPQTGPLRGLPMVLSILLVSKFKNISSKILIFLLCFLALFTMDVGIALILAYCFTLFILLLKMNITFIQFLKNILFVCLFLFIEILLITTIQLLLGYSTINFAGVFFKLEQYSQQGFGMIPMTRLTYFRVFIFIYFCSILYIFKNEIVKKSIIVLFSANIAMLAAVYYVCRSHPHNLFHIGLFFMLLFFLAVGTKIQKLDNSALKKLTYVVLILSFIVFPAFERKQAITNILQLNIANTKQFGLFNLQMNSVLNTKYSQEKKLLVETFTSQQIPILSPDDSYFLYLVNKSSMLYANPQSADVSLQEVKLSVRTIAMTCPKTIAVDPRLFNPKQDVQTLQWMYASEPYALKIIEKSCNFVYKKTFCTQNLCLAEAEPIKPLKDNV
jgi:hypothetical protein